MSSPKKYICKYEIGNVLFLRDVTYNIISDKCVLNFAGIERNFIVCCSYKLL